MAALSPRTGAIWFRYGEDGKVNGGMMVIFGIKMYININRKMMKDKSPAAYAALASMEDERHEIYRLYQDKYSYKKEPIQKNVDDEINEL